MIKKSLTTLRNNYLPVVLVISMLLSVTAKSQSYQPYPQYGGSWNRLLAKIDLGLPGDTIRPIEDVETNPHIAIKSKVLYYWNPDSLKWLAYSSGNNFSLSNLGSGYRLYSPGGSGVKTLFPGYGITWDSTSNSNGLTPRFDSSTVFPQIRATIPSGGGSVTGVKSVYVDGDSAQLLGDQDNPGVHRAYATDGEGQKGWQPAAIVDLTGAQHGYEVWYDTTDTYTNGRGKFKTRAATGGGGSPTGWTKWQIGHTTNAPDAGDNSIINSGWIDKRIEVWRGDSSGLRLLDSNSVKGYIFDGSTGELTFGEDFLANEFFRVNVYELSDVYDIALEAPPVTAVDITFTSSSTGLTNTSQVFTPSSNDASFGHKGLDTKNLPASTTGRIYFQYVATGDADAILGFNSSNAQAGVFEMPFGVFVSAAGNQIRYVDGTANIVNTGVTAIVGNYYSLYRDGATGSLKVQTSSDAVSWSDMVTLTNTSTATLYIVCDLYGGSSVKLSYPKGLNIE